jgi:hypothetical protein
LRARERSGEASGGERKKWGEKKEHGPVTVINWDPRELSLDLNPAWIQKQVKGELKFGMDPHKIQIGISILT